MSNLNLTELVQELAGVIKFHELDTVDSKAAELLVYVDELKIIDEGGMDVAAYIEAIHQANIVGTCR